MAMHGTSQNLPYPQILHTQVLKIMTTSTENCRKKEENGNIHNILISIIKCSSQNSLSKS